MKDYIKWIRNKFGNETIILNFSCVCITNEKNKILRNEICVCNGKNGVIMQ